MCWSGELVGPLRVAGLLVGSRRAGGRVAIDYLLLLGLVSDSPTALGRGRRAGGVGVGGGGE